MEESCCAVCAEAVEWVAYGECGHLDVCAACIARLRYVCDDRRCCICQSLSPLVFVTRALGSVTRVINDFSILPADVKEGKVESYWFHEGIQAYFDDFDAYKIVKNMCRLSCTACEKSDAQVNQTSKKRIKIKNLERLKDHLSRQHELFFCSLCLANKKVFICDLKLYSRSQLSQHIRSGDPKVDGCESERCGFSGHPFCEYCQTPFYGDNELYFHMSTEHYTCHICTRQYPTKYEYYGDYTDLEIHFRDAHFLCEDDECLDKKFIVFATKDDMKKHAALEHGGNMALRRYSTAFQERRVEGSRRRTHIGGPGVSSNQISCANSSDAEGTSTDFLHDASRSVHILGHSGTSDISSTATSPAHQGSALDFRSVLLNGPNFPPLPTSSKRRRRKPKKNSQGTGNNSVNLLHNPSSSDRISSPSSLAVSPQSRPLTVGPSTSSSSVNPSNHLNFTSPAICSDGSASLPSTKIKHISSSSSALDFVDRRSPGLPACDDRTSKEDDVHAANNILIEKILATLESDPDKFAAFKIISKDYRDGEIEAGEYLSYVHQFGLEHLILDLARLCPDQKKRKELMETSKFRLGSSRRESGKKGGSKNMKKGKEKCDDSCSSKGDTLSDELVDHMKELKLDVKLFKEERSSSNGIDRTGKGKSKTPAVTEMPNIILPETQSKDVAKTPAVTGIPDVLRTESWSNYVIKPPASTEMPKILSAEFQSKDVAKTQAAAETSRVIPDDSQSSNSGFSNFRPYTTVTGGKRKLKKSSKFLKARLGESSASVVPNLNLSALPSDLMVVRPNEDSILASVRGIWRNIGGRRFVTLTEATPCTR